MEVSLSGDNQIITIVVIGVLLMVLVSVVLLLFVFLSRKKIIEKQIENKELEIAHQKKLLQATIITQEEERERIAQDLHDDVSSKLNVVHLYANLLLEGNLSTNEYTTVNQQIIEATNKTLESARKIAHNLLPPILDKFGLKPAIEELADSFNNSKKISISNDINFPREHLKPDAELHLFRITQELINNSIRHGEAEECKISINLANDKLHFYYTDNGIGFNNDDIKNKKGIGLKNIESRVTILNGKLSTKSALNKGIQVSIII